MLRHKSEAEKSIGYALLIGHDFGIKRTNAIGQALQGDFQDRRRNADARAKFSGDFASLAGRPAIDVGNAGENRVDRGRAGVGELLRRKIELTVWRQTDTIRQR